MYQAVQGDHPLQADQLVQFLQQYLCVQEFQIIHHGLDFPSRPSLQVYMYCKTLQYYLFPVKYVYSK